MLISNSIDQVKSLMRFFSLTVPLIFLHPQMRLCNPARWQTGSITHCQTMGQVWSEERLLLQSASVWNHPAFTPMPKARISGWMGSFAVPHARTASVMASRSAIGLFTSMRRFVFISLSLTVFLRGRNLKKRSYIYISAIHSGATSPVWCTHGLEWSSTFWFHQSGPQRIGLC